MERYRNLAGDSGVVAYEIRDDAIVVKFVGGDRYLYSFRAPGREHVTRMKAFARAGRGLSSYISAYVREHYEKKL